MERDKKKDIWVTLAVFIVVVFIVAASVTKNKKLNASVVSSGANTVSSTTPTTATTPAVADTTTTAPATSATSSANTSGYTDGTYSATGNYYTPGQSEAVTVKVTLKDGVITATTASATAYDRDSRAYSSAFVQRYQSYVVGKSIASLRLSRVSGASLTTQGFNDAIDTIKSQAKA